MFLCNVKSWFSYYSQKCDTSKKRSVVPFIYFHIILQYRAAVESGFVPRTWYLNFRDFNIWMKMEWCKGKGSDPAADLLYHHCHWNFNISISSVQSINLTSFTNWKCSLVCVKSVFSALVHILPQQIQVANLSLSIRLQMITKNNHHRFAYQNIPLTLQDLWETSESVFTWFTSKLRGCVWAFYFVVFFGPSWSIGLRAENSLGPRILFKINASASVLCYSRIWLRFFSSLKFRAFFVFFR